MISNLCGVLIVPMCMIFMGMVFLVAPPKKIHVLYGYRTKRSTSSMEAWKFAHAVSGGIALKLGVATLIVSSIAFIIIRDSRHIEDICTVIMILELLIMFLIIPYTENQLKKRF